MRTLLLTIGGFVALTSAAYAQDDARWRPYAAVTAGGEYGFPNGFGLPEFVDDSVEGSLALGAEYGDLWDVQASFIKSDNDEGYAFGVGFEMETCVGVGPLTCAFAAKARDVSHEATVTYTAGLSVDLSMWGPLQPTLAIGADAITGDVSEANGSAALELGYDNAFGVERLELSARGGVTHGFEAGETDPTWGAAIDYEWGGSDDDRFAIEAKYESVLTFNDAQVYEVERELSATFKFRFN